MRTFSTRAEVIQQLAAASLTGTLGLFIGSGFSKAITNLKAPTWGALLKAVAKELALKDHQDDLERIRGWSFPRLATDLVDQLSEALAKHDRFKSAPPAQRRAEAVRRLKIEVSRQTAALVPDTTTRAALRACMKALEVAWVITTNYDFLAEDTIEHAEARLPNQVLRGRRNCVPVFHVHGHMHQPDSIVLTEEDYVRALDHDGYGHLRLSILLAESTTLMLGYALGDTNVHTAMSFARAYTEPSAESHAGDGGQVFFLARADAPADGPRVGAWGEVIIEAKEIVSFLEELVGARTKLAEKWNKAQKLVEELVKGAGNFREKFVGEEVFRRGFVKAARDIPALLSAQATVELVRDSLGAAAQKAYAEQGWKNYKAWLAAVLDVLEFWPVATMPPLLFEYIAKELRSLARYIEPDGKNFPGFAFEATDLWHQRKKEVFTSQPNSLAALKAYAERDRAFSLAELLERAV